jgi:hypothetical protein
MPKREKTEDKHIHICIRIIGYEVCVQAGMNHAVYAPEFAWNLDEDDPLYEFSTRIVLSGIGESPSARAGHHYEVTLVGEDTTSPRLRLTLRDVQARDGNSGVHLYRSYRGKQIPVFHPPAGIGTVGKVRGENRWTAYFFVPPSVVANALTLLGHDRDLYLSLHERTLKRRHWIQNLSLQTSDPADE